MPNLWEQFSDSQLQDLGAKRIHVDRKIEIAAELMRRENSPEYRKYIERPAGIVPLSD